MTPWWWSVLLAVIGLTGLYIAGRKSYWGWAIGLASQILWVVYALVSDQWGFILSAAGYGAIYLRNLLRWLAEDRQEAAREEGSWASDSIESRPGFSPTAPRSGCSRSSSGSARCSPGCWGDPSDRRCLGEGVT